MQVRLEYVEEALRERRRFHALALLCSNSGASAEALTLWQVWLRPHWHLNPSSQAVEVTPPLCWAHHGMERDIASKSLQRHPMLLYITGT